MAQTSHNKVLVIIGPTASGKSGLAIDIAQKMNGEIISADSRQVYRGMDIGTGKVTIEEQSLAKHWLLDIVGPMEQYNVTDFQRDAQAAIKDIQSRGKLPIVCGGTGFWVQALVENQHFPGVEPDWKLREELSQLTKEELFAQLEELDPDRAQTVDKNNPVRLIRAIEIALNLNQQPTENSQQKTRENPPFVQDGTLDSCLLLTDHCYLTLALNPPFETLKEKIKKRLDERFDQGMIEEVVQLHEQGTSWERLEGFGLEYKWIAYYLQGKATEQEMKEKLYFAIVHYAKRQLTWLRRWQRQGATIRWITLPEEAFEILPL